MLCFEERETGVENEVKILNFFANTGGEFNVFIHLTPPCIPSIILRSHDQIFLNNGVA